MLTPGQKVELAVEKPAAGGRMIARHDGQVVLVSGAVPGERVLARDRAHRAAPRFRVGRRRQERVARSPRRRSPIPACGGCVYSHIAYPRQLALKADIVRDAFLRLGRIPIDGPIPVAPSPERGYRMRARFHVDGTRVGFYREGTHALCDAAATGQVSDAALDVGRRQRSRPWSAAGARIEWVELTESVDGSQRALAVAVDDVSGDRGKARWRRWRLAAGWLGCAIQDRRSGRGSRLASPR